MILQWTAWLVRTRWLAFYVHSSKSVGLHLEIFSNLAKFLIRSSSARGRGGGDCVTSQKNVCVGRLKQLLIRLCLLVWVLVNVTFVFSIFCIASKSRSVRETKQQAFCYMTTTIVAAGDEERSLIFTSGFHFHGGSAERIWLPKRNCNLAYLN